MQESREQKTKQTIIEHLEQAREVTPQVTRLVAAIIQESLAEFVGPLLMIGLILSMSNFLLDGAIFRSWSGIPFIWIMVQCIAVDANMGVMLVRSVKNLHDGECFKGIIYLGIAIALLFVAAIISDVEAVQSVINRSLDVIFGHLHISVEVLTLVRSSAIVALVAATPLESVSIFRWVGKSDQVTAIGETPEPPPDEPVTAPMINVFEAATLVNTMQELIEEARVLKLGTTRELPETKIINLDGMQPEPPGTTNEEQEQRLREAYEMLRGEGDISVNKLQKAAKVRREVASAWLKQQEEVIAS